MAVSAFAHLPALCGWAYGVKRSQSRR